VPRVEERLGLGAGEQLDPERARQADQRAVDAVGAQVLAPARRVVPRGVEGAVGLAGEDEREAVARAPQRGRLGAVLERGEEGLGPQVLVDVEAVV
jgi:hypothetical protein